MLEEVVKPEGGVGGILNGVGELRAKVGVGAGGFEELLELVGTLILGVGELVEEAGMGARVTGEELLPLAGVGTAGVNFPTGAEDGWFDCVEIEWPAGAEDGLSDGASEGVTFATLATL